MRRRRDHDARRARIHRCLRQRAHGGKSGRRDADDDLHVLGALDEADRHLLGFRRVELRRLAQNAEHGDAVAADFGVEIGQPVDRFLVDAAVVVERCRRDRKGAGGLGVSLSCGSSCLVVPGPCEASNRFKTLVTEVDGALTVAVVPVTGDVDLKVLASAGALRRSCPVRRHPRPVCSALLCRP